MPEIWKFDPDMPVDTIMRTWPQTIRVMIEYRMLCIGCPIAVFHTVSEACMCHGVDKEAFVARLARAATGEIDSG